MAERKGKKLRRCTAQSKARYNLQFGLTDRNKKRRLVRHIRQHPNDRAAREVFEIARSYGDASGIHPQLSKKREARMRMLELQRA